MAQEKLNLLKFSTVGVAQLGASATQIVRRNVLKPTAEQCRHPIVMAEELDLPLLFR
jgi:hypothetical protein